MENSLLFIFDEIWPNIVQGLWPDFGATLKIHKKSSLDLDQLKLSTQHKDMYMYQRILSFSFLTKFGQIPCTIVRGYWPDFGAILKFIKNPILIGFQLKLSTHHNNMPMHWKKYKNREFSPFHF